jgi:chromosome segregation ATPase
VAHFEGVIGDSVTLPGDMKYEMVTPYTQEMQGLRQENELLKNQLDTLRALFDRVRWDRDALRDKLAEVNATLQDLSEQYQATRSILDSYRRVYNSLQEKYENLRGNCSLLLNVCNQTYHELTAKLNEKHAALVNMTQRYNECANQVNRLYEEHQKLQADYDNVSWRLSIFMPAAFAAVAAIGGLAMWISIKHDRLARKYDELVEELERLE